MKPEQVREHWENWAGTYKTDLRATTKGQSIKRLEIAALHRAMKKAHLRTAEVLEVGCGNGYNLIKLAELIPSYNFTGIDYISDMIVSAKLLPAPANVKFEVGDIRNLDEKKYDIIFTDRCLINLDNETEQELSFIKLSERLNPGGSLIILENFRDSHKRLNEARRFLGLPERKVAEFNLFLDDIWLDYAKDKMELVYEQDFGGLHDLMLYVLLPNELGVIDYDNPIMDSVVKLSMWMSETQTELKGYGQNRLYMFQAKEA